MSLEDLGSDVAEDVALSEDRDEVAQGVVWEPVTVSLDDASSVVRLGTLFGMPTLVPSVDGAIVLPVAPQRGLSLLGLEAGVAAEDMPEIALMDGPDLVGGIMRELEDVPSNERVGGPWRLAAWSGPSEAHAGWLAAARVRPNVSAGKQAAYTVIALGWAKKKSQNDGLAEVVSNRLHSVVVGTEDEAVPETRL